MPTFKIVNAADDGYAGYIGFNANTGSTGGIGLSVTCYGQGDFVWNWTPIVGQKSYNMVIKNAIGSTVWAPGCGGIAPSTDQQNTSGQPLLGLASGPFTLEVTFYDGSGCTGSVIGSGTANGWDITGLDVVHAGANLNSDGPFGSDEDPNAVYGLGSYFRFTNVTIDQGAAIVSATLRLQSTGRGSAAIQPIRIIGEDSDNVTTNPSSKANFDARTRTTAFHSETPAAWVASVSYDYDVKTIIQEIVDRGGWVNGNAMLLFWEDGNAAIVRNSFLGAADFPSLNAPQLIVTSGVTSVGTAAGTSTCTAVGQAGHKGTATGQADVTGFSASTAFTVGSAAGTGTALAVGGAVGSAAGVVTVLGVGVTAAVAVGASAGVATVTGVGLGENESIGVAAGTSTVLAIGAWTHAGVGSATGVATVNAVSEATKESIGAIAGIATVSAVGLLGQVAVGSATGVAVVSGVGLVESKATGSAAGTSTAPGVGTAVTEAVGSAAGTSTALAVRAMLIEAVGISLGLGTATGRALTIQQKFLNDLAERQGIRTLGTDSAWLLELSGATIIEPTAFEPDPATFRGTHYYNSVADALYRKIVTRREPGIVVAHWQKVSA